MDIPAPVPGLVIRYAYLWADEHEAGHEEGTKDRPVGILLTTTDHDGIPLAVALPITHTPPDNRAHAVEIPAETKRRLGLDDDRSWIVLTEVNVFRWPGPDVRPIPGQAPATIAHGLLPANFFHTIRDRVAANIRAGRLRQVPRTE